MATLTSILGTAVIKDSRSTINTNYQNLNADKAEVTSASLLGVPNAPTAAFGTNTTQLATTQFTQQAMSSVTSAAITISSVAGSVLSLTTNANERVIVWSRGLIHDNYNGTVSLKYNNVTKDSATLVAISSTNHRAAFSLMYAETPGADTQNITVTTSSGTISGIKIIAMKLN